MSGQGWRRARKDGRTGAGASNVGEARRGHRTQEWTRSGAFLPLPALSLRFPCGGSWSVWQGYDCLRGEAAVEWV